MDSFQTVDLYGGACMFQIPTRFVDISQFRQVNDNQEIFADSKQTDQSIIVEVVEYDAQIPDANIAEFHFRELAEANDATEGATIVHQQLLYPTSQNSLTFDSSISNFPKAFVVGTQQIAKYKETAKNVVNIYLFILRLPQYQSEILISLNDPVILNPQSSASSNAVAIGTDTNASMAMFQQLIQSFKIVDFSLFE